VLAFVVLHDHAVSRTAVAEALWPDVPPARAHANLRRTLWRLRHLAGGPIQILDDDHLRADPAMWVDYRAAITQARALRDGMAPESGSLDPEPFVEDLLPEWGDQEDPTGWFAAERERFRQLRLHALERLSERLTDARRFGEAIEAAQDAVTADPFRETAHRVLIIAYLAEGNTAEAVRQYRSLSELLDRELGVRPSFEIGLLMKSFGLASS
jgi:DNA-binding SARP family transcriptional activator